MIIRSRSGAWCIVPVDLSPTGAVVSGDLSHQPIVGFVAGSLGANNAGQMCRY